MMEPDLEDYTGTTTNLIVVVFGLLGFLLIAVSLLFQHKDVWGYVSEFLKELGIVILAVFVTSFLYEVSVAKRYHKKFLRSLRAQMELGETNAANCEKLGIRDIFVTRDRFQQEEEYSLERLVLKMEPGSSLKVVAKSGISLIENHAILKEAIKRGAAVQICLFNYRLGNARQDSRLLSEVAKDAEYSLGILQTGLIEWYAGNHEKQPTGTLTVKLHDLAMIDSFLEFSSTEVYFGLWDVSFGKSPSQKRIFVVDTKKELGKNLAERYQKIWNSASDEFPKPKT